MSGRSRIEWTDATWTPIRARNKATGKSGHYCVHVSEGCRNCYAERMQARFNNPIRYAAQDHDKVDLYLDADVLPQPLAWQRPRIVFVCSMTDLFGEWVPDEWIDRVFAVMALCPQHTFQVLTKRPERMRGYFDSSSANDERRDDIAAAAFDIACVEKPNGEWVASDEEALIQPDRWPLGNVWKGVSVEDQATADERIPHLLATPAAVRFASYEPALGPVDFTRIDMRSGFPNVPQWHRADVLRGGYWSEGWGFVNHSDLDTLDWIICGGESGPGARPMHPDWARGVRDQCAAAGVPFFFKQWGEWGPAPHPLDIHPREIVTVLPSGPVREWQPDFPESRLVQDGMKTMHRVGKKRAGRLLDGVGHDAMPRSLAGQ